MPDWLTAAAARRPDHPAVVAPDGTATYAELDARADTAARRLAALGVGEGGRVATELAPSLAFCELLHAAPRLGAALVPLSTRLPTAERRAQAAAVDADVVVAAPLEDGIEAALEPRREPDPAAVHTVLFTSGTEGRPKAVELTVANHDASAAASAAAFGVADGDRWLCPLPLFHVAGIGVLVRCARNATTAVLHDRFDAGAVAAALAAGEATLTSLVPTQLRRLRDAGLTSAPGLRALLLGGGPIPPDLVEWAEGAGLPVRCTYGMTETASQVAVTEPYESAATVLAGAEVAIAPDGEILVRGAMVAPAAAGPDGWLRTGDLGALDRRGRLRVAGRIKELIVTGGEKVAPAAVEAVLCAHPAVADAGVGAIPDPDWGEAVTAYVVERRAVSDYELLAFCRERLAGYQVPKLVVRVAELPRNPGGKLLRGRLADAPRAAG
ncbi:MAG: 2-succinylbenzoate--CoA ligase [Solirubrobacterales bacterium]|nr:2-succinylbenzoate--CoA ligase [Solirubrobacterales bacterium]